MAEKISIIIPARNEEAQIGKTLAYLGKYAQADNVEIIVAEGGSEDCTAEVARSRAIVIHAGDCTRAGLMNAGASAATGDVFFFLHADSFPPPDFAALIYRALADKRVVGGAFEQQFIEPICGLRLTTAIDRLRYRLTGNYFGDQGIFVRKDIFHIIAGFPNRGILEDVEFCKRMREVGRTVLLPEPVLTSGRRFLNGGIFRTFLWIAILLLRHRLGIDTERYAWEYRRENAQRRPTGAAGGIQ